MKKLIILIVCGLALLDKIEAQNLVPNPSFEQYDTCPNDISQVNYLKFWRPFRPNPDYYNSCSNYNYISVPYGGVPVFQCPANGNGFCGFFAYHSIINNCREYIGCKLNDSLIINTKYYISAKYNLANSSNFAINKIGFLFTTNSYNNVNYLPITNYANFCSQTIINDTMNWTTVSGSFIADSSYKYIVIGNFFKDSLTDTLHLPGNSCFSYYLVDDVCVSTDSLTCVIPNEQNLCDSLVYISEKNHTKVNILIFPNPAINELTIDFALKDKYLLVLYDMLGTKRKTVKLNGNSKTEIIDLTDIDSGLYFYSVFDSRGNRIKTGKFNVIK